MIYLLFYKKSSILVNICFKTSWFYESVKFKTYMESSDTVTDTCSNTYISQILVADKLHKPNQYTESFMHVRLFVSQEINIIASALESPNVYIRCCAVIYVHHIS